MSRFISRNVRRAAVAAIFALPAAAVAQTWQRVGPLTADVCSVAGDPSASSTLYAGLTGGGMFRSVDGGSLWTLVSSSPSRLCNLVVSPTDPQLLVALGGAKGTAYSSSPVVSENGGASWTPRSPAGSAGFEVAALALGAGTPEEIYLVGRANGASIQHFWRSADRGRSWVAIDAALPKEFYGGTLAVDPAGPGRLVVGLQAGIYRSTDDGQSWSRIGAAPLLPSGATELWFDPTPGGALFALAPYTAGLARSADGGATWQPIALPESETPTALAADPASGNLFLATNGFYDFRRHVHRSTDGGLTWQAASAPALTKDLRLLGTASGLIAWSGGGVARSIDFAASWSLANQGLQAGGIDGLAQGPTGELFATFDTYQAFRRAPDGTWKLLAPPNDWFIEIGIDPGRSALLYDTGISDVQIVRSLDAGATWSASQPLQCWSGTRSLFVGAAAIYLSADADCLASGLHSCRLMRSENLGNSWSCIATIRIATDFIGTDKSGNTVYATDGTRLFRSTDRGVHLPVRGPLPKGAQKCAGIVVHPERPDVLVCNAPGNLLWSSDGGKRWRKFGSNPGLAGKRFTLRTGPGGVVQLLGVAGRADRDALVYTPDGGKTWKELTPPWPRTYLRKPLFDPTDPSAFLVGSDGAGVLRARLAP
jgi:photosystem II stability/assembly factor-like uncharacterized protein